ncbi:hypothetical protein GCM10022269_20750 [Sphingorhabdus rigui]
MCRDINNVNLRVPAQFTLGYDGVVCAVAGRDAEIQIRVRKGMCHVFGLVR